MIEYDKTQTKSQITVQVKFITNGSVKSITALAKKGGGSLSEFGALQRDHNNNIFNFKYAFAITNIANAKKFLEQLVRDYKTLGVKYVSLFLSPDVEQNMASKFGASGAWVLFGKYIEGIKL